VVAAKNQIAFLKEEIQTVRALVEKGQALRPRLLALERQAAELGGRQGEYQAAIARSRQTIAQAEVEILNVKIQRRNDVEKELRDVQSQFSDFNERLKAAEDVKNRLDIVAPQSGVITNLSFHTIGGVIQPGVPIMEIVPKDDKLIVEAKVSLTDIDIVHAGLPARVRLSAFKARRVPIIEAKVVSVSADRVVDKSGTSSYYLARIEVDENELKNQLSEHVELYPGMPADVLIVTGSRTLLGYLFAPIGDSMFRAFREQ
jgi:HlyD family secretion protein